MPNTPIRDHPLIGTTHTYRPDLPAYDAATDDARDGTLILGAGMTVRVDAVFDNWNAVGGLDMLYVHCTETGYSTHVTPADLGLSRITLRVCASCDEKVPDDDSHPSEWLCSNEHCAIWYHVGGTECCPDCGSAGLL